MSAARQAILGRVRSALKRAPGAPPPPPPPVRLHAFPTSLEERIEQFSTALGKLNGVTKVVSSESEAQLYIDGVVAGRTFCTAASTRDEIVRADVGVSGVDYGLADTGTLVTLSASDPRLVSLLPPTHIAVLDASRLLSTLDELLQLLPQPALQTASMVLITGPSRTADIEQILVRGVHGPGELHVVMIR
ncbi:MAG: lactate utilization protein [Bryobacteraceae bacterium]|nr:lactate utilization protein [Bryobacteraceae bacterium]